MSYSVTMTFPSKEVALHFAEFMSETEQSMWEWDTLSNIEPVVDFKDGSIDFQVMK